MIIDKPFTIYVVALVLGVAMVLTTSIVYVGGYSLPPLGYMVEHLALALAFRGAYKSLDGRNYLVPVLEFIGIGEPVEAETSHGAGAEAHAY